MRPRFETCGADIVLSAVRGKGIFGRRAESEFDVSPANAGWRFAFRIRAAVVRLRRGRACAASREKEMMAMNVSTAIVLAVIVVCVCLAVRSFRKKGMCGCKEHCSCSGSCASGCSACALSEDAIREMSAAAERADAS